MRSKTIISILAFAAAFGFSAYFASFFLPETVKSENFYYDDYAPVRTHAGILNLLRQDDINGNERRFDYEDSDDQAEDVSFKNYITSEAKLVNSYVDKSSSLNASDLPCDFRSAWRVHMKAWRDYSDFMNKSAKTKNVDADEFREKEVELIDDINSTWGKVLDVSETYHDNIRYEIQD
jgi:hypothetical protein